MSIWGKKTQTYLTIFLMLTHNLWVFCMWKNTLPLLSCNLLLSIFEELWIFSMYMTKISYITGYMRRTFVALFINLIHKSIQSRQILEWHCMLVCWAVTGFNLCEKASMNKMSRIKKRHSPLILRNWKVNTKQYNVLFLIHYVAVDVGFSTLVIDRM